MAWLEVSKYPALVHGVTHLSTFSCHYVWKLKILVDLWLQIILYGLVLYSPSPEYPVACYRDEWQGDAPKLFKAKAGWSAILAQFSMAGWLRRILL